MLGAAGAVRLTNILSDSGERLPDFVADVAHKARAPPGLHL